MRHRSMLVVGSILLAACAGAGGDVAIARPHAEAIGEAECGSCGMIVREQPAPRAQVAHRDGTHAWFCSIADVVAYLGSPSPHGRVESIWVETLAPGAEPTTYETGDRPWAEAASAGFVLGVERDGVMGAPVLVFATLEDARAAAERLGARAARWDEVQAALGGAP